MALKYSFEHAFPTILRENESVLDLSLGHFRYFHHFMRNRPATQHVVTPNEDGRLDLISFHSYGTVDLWWIIGLVNGLVDPIRDPHTGRVLVIPSLFDIEEYFQLMLSAGRGQAIQIG